MTNRDIVLKILNEDINYLAQTLIVTNLTDEGDWSFDGEDEYYVEHYVDEYLSPSGNVYSERDYNACLEDTIKWLNEEVMYDK